MCGDYRCIMLPVVLWKKEKLEKLTELQLTVILFFYAFTMKSML